MANEVQSGKPHLEIEEVEPAVGGLRDSTNVLKLGLFSTNVSGGMNLSAVSRQHGFSWDHVNSIARRADELNFEFLVPVARWLGYKGEVDAHGATFETFTWASGIAATTKQITIAATAHLPILHPVLAAKLAATADQISHGRLALNAVMGWYEPEMAMFDIRLRAHDARYQHGAEWIGVVEKLWSENDPFDFAGDWIKVENAYSKPAPVRKPLLLNAGTSEEGIDFCARLCDYNLGMVADYGRLKGLSDTIKNHARTKYQREIGTLNVCFVICRDTRKEAEETYDRIVEAGDWEAAKNLLHYVGINSESFPDLHNLQELMIATGGGLPLIGTPEEVAEGLAKVSAAGVDGVALGFLDYLEEIDQFDSQVVPLLREAGLRN
jgi:FMNH2-dependent dimethyl sulfone monooxygenase